METSQQGGHFCIRTNLIYPCPVTKVYDFFCIIRSNDNNLYCLGCLKDTSDKYKERHPKPVPVLFIWYPVASGRKIYLFFYVNDYMQVCIRYTCRKFIKLKASWFCNTQLQMWMTLQITKIFRLNYETNYQSATLLRSVTLDENRNLSLLETGQDNMFLGFFLKL